ncbi:MAG: ClpXP protease specificity-enhancing factor SspB, partial [Caldimonas sp.]
GNELIEFKARFGGTSREIAVPIDHVIAIYARENGQGMAFPMPSEAGGDGAEAGKAEAPTAGAPRPRLAGSSGAAARKGAALTLSPSPAKSGSEPPAEPPPSGPPMPKRPSLKRVK